MAISRVHSVIDTALRGVIWDDARGCWHGGIETHSGGGGDEEGEGDSLVGLAVADGVGEAVGEGD